jgi:hypothetical protein
VQSGTLFVEVGLACEHEKQLLHQKRPLKIARKVLAKKDWGGPIHAAAYLAIQGFFATISHLLE